MWIAHSKLSNTCRLPARITSNDLSYSLPQVMHSAIVPLLFAVAVHRAIDVPAPCAAARVRETRFGHAHCTRRASTAEPGESPPGAAVALSPAFATSFS